MLSHVFLYLSVLTVSSGDDSSRVRLYILY